MINFLLKIIYCLFVIMIVILGSIFLFYRYAATDMDCWLSNDPIICQKIKDGVK